MKVMYLDKKVITELLSSKHKLENVRIDLIKDKLKQSRIISAELK